jgi:hypothetical protein
MMRYWPLYNVLRGYKLSGIVPAACFPWHPGIIWDDHQSHSSGTKNVASIILKLFYEYYP